MTSSADGPDARVRQIAELDRQIERFRTSGQDTSPVEAAREYLKAQLARHLGDLDAAQAHYASAVSGFRQTDMGAQQSAVAVEGARAMQAAGRLGPALELAGEAIDGAELLWLGISAADRLQTPRELVDAADAAVPIAFAAGEAVQMFDILQRCKARWFNEQLVMREATRLPIVQLLAGQSAPAPALGEAIAALDEAWDGFFANDPEDARPPAEDALVHAYSVEAGRRRRLRPLDAATSSIDTCRHALRPTEGLLEYFVSTNETFAVLLTADTLKIEPLGIGAVELGSRIVPAMAALQSTPDRRGFARSAAQSDSPKRQEMLGAVGEILYPAPAEILSSLGELLIGKLAAALTPLRRLIVCPHWWLHPIPFHALSTRAGGMLAATTSVTYAPNASCWERLRRLAPPVTAGDTPRVAVLGVERGPKPSWFSQQLAHGAPPEPQSPFELEAQAVAALSGTPPVLGEAATKAAFAAALEQADIVHVSCHNATSRPAALTNGLLLSDGIVTVAELSVVSRPEHRGPQLVTLRACRSGVDRIESGDLRIDPCHALAARYGCGVISSLWSVDAEATEFLMARLHHHRPDAGDWAEALRRAQLDTRSASSRTQPEGPGALDFSEPYYWSGFFVFGP